MNAMGNFGHTFESKVLNTVMITETLKIKLDPSLMTVERKY